MEFMPEWKHFIKIQKTDENIFILSKRIPLPIAEDSSLHAKILTYSY